MAQTRTSHPHPNITVREAEHIERVAPAIRKISKLRVLVGIPEQNDARSDTNKIGNAMIGYINELGSPLQGIWPRPHLVPGVQAALDSITNQFRIALVQAFEGKPADNVHLHRAGILAVNSVRRVIQAKIPPPLSQATIDRRRQRSPGSKYRRKAKTAATLANAKTASTTPLIDTGTYLRNITHVIRNT